MQILEGTIQIMILTPHGLALLAVLIIGYLGAVSIGTLAYFANEKDS